MSGFKRNIDLLCKVVHIRQHLCFLGTQKMMTSIVYFGVPQKAMVNLFIPLDQCAAKIHNDSLQQDFLRDFLNVSMNNHTRIQLNWQTCYHRMQAGLDCQRGLARPCSYSPNPLNFEKSLKPCI